MSLNRSVIENHILSSSQINQTFINMGLSIDLLNWLDNIMCSLMLSGGHYIANSVIMVPVMSDYILSHHLILSDYLYILIYLCCRGV